MARVKLSEYRAKNLVYNALGKNYVGHEIVLHSQGSSTELLDGDKMYVTKVDQAVKKRNKLGLVTVNRNKEQVAIDLGAYHKQGYAYALVELYIEHDKENEHFISMQRTEHGIELHYSSKGGVDIEDNVDSVESSTLLENGFDESRNTTKLPNEILAKLYGVFQEAHMTYLEINPCVMNGRDCTPLDAAVEVDSSAQFFVHKSWNEADVRTPKGEINDAEKAVNELASKSPASLSLKVLNPNGSVFLLLSGGGASVVVADEISNLGHLDDIANYGEYSGNPNEEETYLYTKQVLKLLINSTAQKKVLLIAGGVANFTDVAKTFKGIIRAISDVAEEMASQGVTVFVRRGGPNQEAGLLNMSQFLDKVEIMHAVRGPDVSLGAIVAEAVKSIES